MSSLNVDRACDLCLAQPAVWRHPVTWEALCHDDGLVQVGAMEGEYSAAREQLTDAVVTLSGLGITGDDVLGIVRGELEGTYHRIAIERDNPTDPRPWTSVLLPLEDS